MICHILGANCFFALQINGSLEIMKIFPEENSNVRLVLAEDDASASSLVDNHRCRLTEVIHGLNVLWDSVSIIVVELVGVNELITNYSELFLAWAHRHKT